MFFTTGRLVIRLSSFVREEAVFYIMEALKQQTTQKQINHWTDLWFTEDKKAGYVAITDFERQLFFGYNDISNVINSTKGREKQFISLNAFDVNWQEKEFSRETAALKQIRNIGIDIDQYKLNLTADETLDEIQALITDNKIPEPNLILVSRGIQIFYSIDRGASPEMAWLSSYITDQLVGKLQHIGADSNAKDISRVMRVPGSINERNHATVKPLIWNDTAYSLQELQSYCKPLDKFNRRKQIKNKVVSLPTSSGLMRHYRSNYARLHDFNKLIEMRGGDFTGMRNTFLYMYSYHQALSLDAQKDLIPFMKNVFKDVYSRTDKPMTKKEFESTVRSAHKDAERFFEHYQANGYRVIYKHSDGIKKPYKTTNIIDKLDITKEEQHAMKSLRCSEIAKKQHSDYMRTKRRSAGMGTRQEYNNARKRQSKDKQEQLKQFMSENPNASKTEMAREIGVSRQYIYIILKSVT